MRQLTEQERQAKAQALEKYDCDKYVTVSEYRAFTAGFVAGLDYQQRKLNAYATFVAGKITLKELEEVINA